MEPRFSGGIISRAVEPAARQATLALDVLEAQGLVRRHRRAQDMRIRDVSITEEGRAAFERVWAMMHARFQACLTASRRTSTALSPRLC